MVKPSEYYFSKPFHDPEDPEGIVSVVITHKRGYERDGEWDCSSRAYEMLKEVVPVLRFDIPEVIENVHATRRLSADELEQVLIDAGLTYNPALDEDVKNCILDREVNYSEHLWGFDGYVAEGELAKALECVDDAIETELLRVERAYGGESAKEDEPDECDGWLEDDLIPEEEELDDLHDRLMDIAEGLYAQEKYDLAASVYERALGVHPDRDGIRTMLGAALYKEGKYDDAVWVWKSELKLRPDNVQALQLIGITLFEKGDNPGAAEHYQRLVRLDPEKIGEVPDELVGLLDV